MLVGCHGWVSGGFIGWFGFRSGCLVRLVSEGKVIKNSLWSSVFPLIRIDLHHLLLLIQFYFLLSEYKWKHNVLLQVNIFL